MPDPQTKPHSQHHVTSAVVFASAYLTVEVRFRQPTPPRHSFPQNFFICYLIKKVSV